ncbi:MAG: 30S ribosomal protein S20 [Acidiferrobacterales bacterium]
MANTSQARKRARQAIERRARNFGLRSKVRTYIRRVAHDIDQEDKAAAQQSYREAVKIIDRVVSKGVLPKNTAARHKSRLNARIRALG